MKMNAYSDNVRGKTQRKIGEIDFHCLLRDALALPVQFAVKCGNYGLVKFKRRISINSNNSRQSGNKFFISWITLPSTRIRKSGC